jgi:hypothetical protein
LRTFFLSAGTTYHGAVLGARARERVAVRGGVGVPALPVVEVAASNFQFFAGSSSRARSRSACSAREMWRRT